MPAKVRGSVLDLVAHVQDLHIRDAADIVDQINSGELVVLPDPEEPVGEESGSVDPEAEEPPVRIMSRSNQTYRLSLVYRRFARLREELNDLEMVIASLLKERGEQWTKRAQLWVKEGSGQYRFNGTVSEQQIVGLAKEITLQSLKREGPLSSPQMAADHFITRFHGLEREIFTVMFLDTRHQLITCEEIFWGTINGATVHPREVVKAALQHNSGAVILAHNHPSGIAEPSQSDVSLTRRLREALDLVEIRLLDHLVIGGGDFVSLSDRGLL